MDNKVTANIVCDLFIRETVYNYARRSHGLGLGLQDSLEYELSPSF